MAIRISPHSERVPRSRARDWRWRATLMVLGLGLALRVVQFWGNGSLWLDEIALSRDVLELSVRQLVTEHLPRLQVAPVGFLLTQKGVSTALGSSDYALRLVPFFAAVLAMGVFWRLAERVLDGIGPLVAVTLFSTAVPLIYYGTQAKQYSVDVLASTVIVLCAVTLDLGQPTRRRLLACAAIGAAMVWFSQPALLVIGSCGIVLVARAWWRRASRPNEWWSVAGVVVVWGLSACAALLEAERLVSQTVYADMQGIWANGFPPLSLHEWWSRPWPVDQALNLIGTYGRASLRYPEPILYSALAAAGLLVLVWRRRFVAHITIAIGMAAIAAAVTWQYPLIDRLALYFLPIALLLIAAGIDAVSQIIATWKRSLGHVAAALLVVPCLVPVAASPPPYRIENVYPMMMHLQESRQPGDRIYVFYGGLLAFDYYAPRYGFTPADYAAGECYRPRPRGILMEIDTFRGVPRLWVFFSHAMPNVRDRVDLVGYLDTIGRRIEHIPDEREPDADLFLYDLSDPVRLARSDAEHYSMLGPLPEGSLRCPDCEWRGRAREPCQAQ